MSNINQRKNNNSDSVDISAEIRAMIENRDNVIQRVMDDAAKLTKEDHEILESMDIETN